METAYHIPANELSIDFVKAVKSLFKGKNLFITVADEMDETEYLLSNEANRKMLEKSIQQIESGNTVKVKIGKR